MRSAMTMRNFWAAICAVALIGPAFAGQTHFDIRLADGTQVGEIAMEQTGSGPVKGGLRFRTQLGPEPYDGAAAEEYTVSGTPDGRFLSLTIALNEQQKGNCALTASVDPFVAATEIRLTGTCRLKGRNDGRKMDVVVSRSRSK